VPRGSTLLPVVGELKGLRHHCVDRVALVMLVRSLVGQSSGLPGRQGLETSLEDQWRRFMTYSLVFWAGSWAIGGQDMAERCSPLVIRIRGVIQGQGAPGCLTPAAERSFVIG
jgi:hypothetical protein